MIDDEWYEFLHYYNSLFSRKKFSRTNDRQCLIDIRSGHRISLLCSTVITLQ